MSFVPRIVAVGELLWDLLPDGERPGGAPANFVCHAKALGARVSLFMDPIPEAMAAAKAVGADRVELYTETYASAYGTPKEAEVLAAFKATAEAALAVSLGINAGHDLNRDNLHTFLTTVPGVQEVSIGHALIGDALEMGYTATIHAYHACMPKV